MWVKSAPSAVSRASRAFAPHPIPANGGTRITAISAPATRTIGTSRSIASGLKPRRSVNSGGLAGGWVRRAVMGLRKGYSGGTGRYDWAMRRAIVVLTALAAALAPGIAAAQSSPSVVPATPVVVIKVEGAIDRILMSYVNDRLAAAENSGAVVVLQLNTSGSLNQDGLGLASRVAAMRVPVIAWVGPVPAKAAGAGLLLMYAASLAAVAPGSQTGPLHPIDLGQPDAGDAGLEQTIQGWLATHGRSAELTRLDSALPAQDAIDLGVAQVRALSVPDLLNVLDGRTVRTPAGDQLLETRIATNEQQANERTVDISFENMGPIDRTLHAVASPSMIYFLVVIGLACLAFEITQPGFGFAGAAGVGMLGLGMFGLW